MASNDTSTSGVELVPVADTTSHESVLVTFPRFRSRTPGVYQQLAEANKYVEELEALLAQHSIPLPETKSRSMVKSKLLGPLDNHGLGIMTEGNRTEIKKLTSNAAKFQRQFPIGVTFRNLGFWAMVPEAHIETVGNAITNMVHPGPKHRVDILKGLTGRLLPRRMTLILGPPGCGKSVLLKALSGRLHKHNLSQDGDIKYNGEDIDSTDKFLIPKVADYIEQTDTHAATLTVEETVLYAWKSSSGGHHRYLYEYGH